MALTMALVPTSVAMVSSVSKVSALMGLKERLPQSFTQISFRMRRTGARRPAAMKALASAFTRSVLSPDGSPRMKRLPARCWITPGSTTSVAGYTTQPMARSGPIPSH